MADVLRARFRLQPEKETHLFLADLHHIRLPQPPEELLFCFREILPERRTQIRVIGDELPLRSRVGDGLPRRGA